MTQQEQTGTGADFAAATVVVPSALAAFAGGRSHIMVPLAQGTIEGPRSALTAVLDQLRREVPALERRIRDERGRVRGHVNIYVDGTDIRELAGVGTVIVPGATVHIIAAVSGG
ncbi:MAG TPA: MoaD/ThiS family protein [Actinospica sp.]|nr:MoaD/ThiS family protein [Actinospica sp.]